MIVGEIMTKNVITVSAQSAVSDALSKMKKYRFHNIPVVNKHYIGMICLKDLIRNMDTTTTKVASFVRKTPKLKINDSIDRASRLLLFSETTSLPVLDKKKLVGIISEIDVLQTTKIDQPIKNFATECIVVDKYATIGKVKRLMEKHNISRIPITENEKILGIVDIFSMIKYIESFEPLDVGGLVTKGGSGKKTKKDESRATNFMRQCINIDGNKKVSDLLNLFKEYEELIVDNKYIITPKDILEVIVAKTEGERTTIQVSNLDVDEITAEEIKNKLNRFAKRYEKVFRGPKYLFLHIETINKGGKARRELRIRYHTPEGMFVARSSGWKVLTVLDELIQKIRKEIEQNH